MALHRSLDENEIIAAALHDVHTSLGCVFNYTAYQNTLRRVRRQAAHEGISFLTKTLPRLGKAFDKALSGDAPLNAVDLRLKPQKDSKLPRFLGELFNRVLSKDGVLLRFPSAKCVKVLRQVLYMFYKYELPYSDEQEARVVQKFVKTEEQLTDVDRRIEEIRSVVDDPNFTYRRRHKVPTSQVEVVREARILLSRLFAFFDPKDIYPRHGPGAVATKQRLWDKYLWTNVSRRITDVYPLDEFFFSSLGHVCDNKKDMMSLTEEDFPARVILVPKDSRGPRLISCEPVDFQWVQQGLGRALVQHVEGHVLTKYNVFFTDQGPNQRGALLGSSTGRYATLDLNEASDRVTLSLVHLLFPEHLLKCLDACRSSSTELPSGKILKLRKFAPMGSSLCFPIMALTIWAILSAAAPDADTRESILVYGDDVIVPTAYAVNAMEQLESFGLKINRDKSCIKGLFRESCGTDAFRGVNVTPVRLRTVWSSLRSPDSYESWVAYANSFFRKKYLNVYEYIVERLTALYGSIPESSAASSCINLQTGFGYSVPTEDRVPSLLSVPLQQDSPRRYNRAYQKYESKVWVIKSPVIKHSLPGWSMLLRYFAEAANSRNQESHVASAHSCKECTLPLHCPNSSGSETPRRWCCPHLDILPFNVSSYTRRGTSLLVKRWR